MNSKLNKKNITKILKRENNGIESDEIDLEIKHWENWVNNFPQSTKLYRIIRVEKKEDINLNNPGSHYSNKKKELISNHCFAVGCGENEYLITVLANKNQIDFDATVENRLLYPHENEITLKNKGKGVEVLSVKKIKDSEEPKNVKTRSESFSLIPTLKKIVLETKNDSEEDEDSIEKYQNEFRLIKQRLKEKEYEKDKEFIQKYKKQFQLAKKLTPSIIQLIEENYGEMIEKIEVRQKEVVYGSTYDFENKTLGWQASKLEFQIYSENSEGNTNSLRWNILEKMANFTPFNIKKYGCPIDVKVFTKKSVSDPNYSKDHY